MTKDLLEKAKNIEHNINLCEEALRAIKCEKNARPSVHFSSNAPQCGMYGGLNVHLPIELNPQFEKMIRDYKTELEQQLDYL